MNYDDLKYLEEEIQRYTFPKGKDEESEQAYQRELHDTAVRTYNRLRDRGGDITSWVLLETIDAETMEMKLVWRRKT